LYQEAAVDLVIECLLRITLEKALEALAEHTHVVRAVMTIARRIALMIFFGMGL
jgi:hypothetical protein